MADRNDSLALDLDLFDVTKNGYVPVERKKKKVAAPKLLEPKKLTRTQVEYEVKESRIAAIKASIFALVTLAILGSLIFSRVVLTNLGSQLADQKAELSASQSENIRLQMKFNSMMSMDKVEEYAQSQLGMVKRENCQVNYFDTSSDDGAVLIKSGKVS